jgi:hypothetical protein
MNGEGLHQDKVVWDRLNTLAASQNERCIPIDVLLLLKSMVQKFEFKMMRASNFQLD